jgi:hypothetical protein
MRWSSPVVATLIAVSLAAPSAANAAACRRVAAADPASASALLPICPSISIGRGRSSVASPSIEGPITGGARNRPTVSGTAFDLATVGYTIEEYFLTGTATAYRNKGALRSDGHWRVEPATTAPYKTRIVVYRPADPARFSGTVLVEWLNVSGGLDAAPDWITLHTELVRSGAVWVGVSAQYVGIEAGSSPLTPLAGGLKSIDPARYGTLSHPGDSFSYDMFSQAGAALRAPNGPDPLHGLEIRKLIAAGESQSAFRMVTYVDAIDPVARVYDGFFVHSRGGSGAPLSQSPQADIAAPEVVRIRSDVRVPVMTFQTETDLISLGSYPDRQPDARNFRLWESAGTSHADTYTLSVGFSDIGGDPDVAAVLEMASPIPGIIDCGSPVNSGPQHWVGKAAFAALERWVGGGRAPSHAPRLSIRVSDGEPEFVLDEHGNVEGGIRTSYVDAPVAKLSGLGQTGAAFCRIFGTTVLFDEATIAALYPSNAAYVAAVEQSNDRAVRQGFLLAPDAELISEYVRSSGIGD